STPALPTVVSLQSATGSVTLGAAAILTATISAAQPGPTDVVLRASGLVTVPSTVTIPAGQTNALVTVGTIGLGTALVKASLNGTVAVASIQVTAPGSSPTVTAMTPSQATVSSSVPVTITGTNFPSGAMLSVGAVITVSKGAVRSATQLTAMLAIRSSAAIGARDVTVTRL